MNVTDKEGFQEIYDKGSKRLEELANTQAGLLTDACNGHLDERVKSEPESLHHLEECSRELEKEIKAYVSVGMERIEKLLCAELEQNQNHVSRLVDGLTLLIKRHSESIEQLKEAAENHLNCLAGDGEQLHNAATHAAKREVAHHGAIAKEESAGAGIQAQVQMFTRLDESWDLMADAEEEGIDSLLMAFDTNRHSVIEAFLESSKQLDERMNGKLSLLEQGVKESYERIDGAVNELIQSSDKYAFSSDVKLKEGFSSLLFEASRALDDAANKVQADVAALQQSALTQLRRKSEGLGEEMDSLAQTITQASSEKSDALRDKGSALIDTHTHILTERLNSGRQFLSELESERGALVSEIWQELSDVRTKFESKLAGLCTSTLEKMRTVCSEAETAIVVAQQNSASESKQHSTQKREAIENAASEFLKSVNSRREAALQAIAKASGGGDDTAPGVDEEPAKAPEPPVESAEEPAAEPEAKSEARRRKRSTRHSEKPGEGKK